MFDPEKPVSKGPVRSQSKPAPPVETFQVRIADQEDVFKRYFKESVAIREKLGYAMSNGDIVQANPEALKHISELRKRSIEEAIQEWRREKYRAS